MHKRKHNKKGPNKNNTNKSTPQKEQIQKGVIGSRAEEVQLELNNDMIYNTPLRETCIRSLLFTDYPEVIQKIPGSTEFLDGQFRLYPNYRVQLIKSIVNFNAIKSFEYLAKSYRDLMVNDSRIMDIVSLSIKDKSTTEAIINLIKFRSDDGKNLLHKAISMNNIELIRNLSELDASMISEEDNLGLTPLDYALAYLKNNLISINPSIPTALRLLKSSSHSAVSIVENLIVNQHNYQNKQNNKKPTILKNDQIRNKILQGLEELKTNENAKKIDSLQEFSFVVGTNQELKSTIDMASIYYRMIYSKIYSKQDWQVVKNQIGLKMSNYTLSDDTSLLDRAVRFFVLLTEEITLDNFIKCYFNNSNPKNISDSKTKFYVLCKLAEQNARNKENNLSLSQSLEALELAEKFDENEMIKYKYYNNYMYFLICLCGNNLENTDRNYHDVIIAIEKAEKYLPSDKKTLHEIKKFIAYFIVNKFDNQKLDSIINNIGDKQVQNFLQVLKDSVFGTEKLFEPDVDILVNQIVGINEKEECQYILNYFRNRLQELMVGGKLELDSHIRNKDILSIGLMCYKYSDPEIIKVAVNLIDNNSNYFASSIRHELLQISKALIYISAEKFELSLESLIATNTDKWSNLGSNWKELFCSLLSILALDHNQNISDCIRKIEQVDPNYRMLEVMRLEVETDFQSDENDIEAENYSQVSDKISDQVSESTVVLATNQVSEDAAVPAIEYLTKTEVLGLSERDFLNESKAGRIKPGLQKAYYKQLKQIQLKQDIIESVEKCFGKRGQEKEEIESWTLPSSKVFKSDDSQVMRVDDKTWAVIDSDVINALDFAYRIAFENAITKGFVRSKGVNGIKIIENIAELKIKSDLRLYTEVKYLNDHGASLIIFDKSGNHKEIKRELKYKAEMNCCEVPSFSKDALHISDSLNNSTITLEESIHLTNNQDHEVSSLGQCEDNTL